MDGLWAVEKRLTLASPATSVVKLRNTVAVDGTTVQSPDVMIMAIKFTSNRLTNQPFGA